MSFPPGVPPESEPRPGPQRPEELTGTAVPAVAVASEPAGLETWSEPEEATSARVWHRVRRLGWELAQTLLLAAIIFFAVRAVAQNFRVEGASMEPGLHHGQYLIVNKAIYFKINLKTLSKYLPFISPGENPERFIFRGPKRGDVVVFRFPQDPSRDFIKRVVGVPGDTVEVRAGKLILNGVSIDEPYVQNEGRYDYPPTLVPRGHYFVLGDNRGNSFDSHSWGLLPEENIIGQAMLSYWPLSSFGGVGNTRINLGFVKIAIPLP
jgi:signal peptidase I